MLILYSHAYADSMSLSGLTPLAYSVIAEQLESVKLLVKMGANINVQDFMGRTCLSMAAYQVYFTMQIPLYNLYN